MADSEPITRVRVKNDSALPPGIKHLAGRVLDVIEVFEGVAKQSVLKGSIVWVIAIYRGHPYRIAWGHLEEVEES